MTLTDKDNLLAALDSEFAADSYKFAGNNLTLMALADYYEDQGEMPQASAVRWMLSECKRPVRLSDVTYRWYNQAQSHLWDGDAPWSDLPSNLFARMRNLKPGSSHLYVINFDTLHDAINALAMALEGYT